MYSAEDHLMPEAMMAWSNDGLKNDAGSLAGGLAVGDIEAGNYSRRTLTEPPPVKLSPRLPGILEPEQE